MAGAGKGRRIEHLRMGSTAVLRCQPCEGDRQGRRYHLDGLATIG
jgi:hypothetical protein